MGSGRAVPSKSGLVLLLVDWYYSWWMELVLAYETTRACPTSLEWVSGSSCVLRDVFKRDPAART